jgi:hypothetical protein
VLPPSLSTPCWRTCTTLEVLLDLAKKCTKRLSGFEGSEVKLEREREVGPIFLQVETSITASLEHDEG